MAWNDLGGLFRFSHHGCHREKKNPEKNIVLENGWTVAMTRLVLVRAAATPTPHPPADLLFAKLAFGMHE